MILRYVILLHLSLPSPQGFAFGLWKIIQPQFYHYIEIDVHNLPCQFLWWTTGDVAGSSTVVNVNLKDFTGRKVGVEKVSTWNFYRFNGFNKPFSDGGYKEKA